MSTLDTSIVLLYLVLMVAIGWYVAALAFGCLIFGLFAAARVKQLGDQHQFLTYTDLIEHHSEFPQPGWADALPGAT